VSKEVFKLEGAEALQKLLKEFPDKVADRAQKTGLRKAAARLRTLIRRDTPKESGNLRKAIRTKFHRNSTVTVGLKERFYYKTLEMQTKRGEPLHPFFERSVRKHASAALKIMLDETTKALYREAGKAYARSRANLRK